MVDLNQAMEISPSINHERSERCVTSKEDSGCMEGTSPTIAMGTSIMVQPLEKALSQFTI